MKFPQMNEDQVLTAFFALLFALGLFMMGSELWIPSEVSFLLGFISTFLGGFGLYHEILEYRKDRRSKLALTPT
jgi:hypothetical protein